MTAPTDVDLLIVGAGPTGLFAAYYAGFRELTTVVVDSLPEPGGQVTAMYPEKMIFDVAGFPAVRGRDLIDALVDQADQWKPTYLLGKRAQGLSEVDGKFVIELDGDLDHRWNRPVHPASAARWRRLAGARHGALRARA
jgi:thioredoxin reductase (NADPH)